MRDGRVIPLSPKLFETLLVLVENAGHVVDKDKLYKKVWQDVVVEETNLTKNISILRKILSEGDAERSFIETVPKRGYHHNPSCKQLLIRITTSYPRFDEALDAGIGVA